jgi:hypothetical protein
MMTTSNEEELALESNVVDSATITNHADAITRQNKIVNSNEGKRVERLVEQNEQKVDAIKKILAERQEAEEQQQQQQEGVEVTNSS